jgi:hypothetical protein
MTNKERYNCNNKCRRYYSTKITQIIKGVKELNDALNIYEKKELKTKNKLASSFLIMGFISLFLGPKIALFFPSLVYIVACCEFIISLGLNIYITVKRLQFIYNYPLNCNPNKFVKGIITSVAMGKPLFKYSAAIGGSLLATNLFIENVRGVNVMQEFGKNYIDSDKSMAETVSIIKNKLYKGFKDVD